VVRVGDGVQFGPLKFDFLDAAQVYDRLREPE
jgi:hypothetical protein